MLKKLLVLFIFLFPLASFAQSTAPIAKVFDLSGKLKSSFYFFDSNYSGGVDLALGGNISGGQEKILLCPGAGNQSIVKSFDYIGTDQGQFMAYDKKFTGGCYVASADVDGFGDREVIIGAGSGGGPNIWIFKDGKLLKSFFAFNKNSRNGVRVAAADLGVDGKSEIVAFSNLNSPAEIAVFGNDAHKIYSKLLPEFNANGLNVAIGDYNGDGKKELAIAGGYGNKPAVVFLDDSGQELNRISYSNDSYIGGLNLSAGDINNDGKDELIISESFNGSGIISVHDWSGKSVLTFDVFGADFKSGVKTVVGDIDGDSQKEIIAVPERAGAELKKPDYKSITVDLSKQTLYRYQDGKLLNSYLISSGKVKTPTPTGEFSIYRKRPKVRMSGVGYDLPNVPWVSSFQGAFTIHGTYWHSNFGHQMSHGCVNMYTPDAKVIYDWVDIGTPVVVY